MNTNSEKANNIIRNHMIWSMGAGAIPVPLADFFTVSAVQLDLIKQLCKLYEVDFKEEEGKAIISSLTASILAKLGARTAIKLIPGIGTIIGGVTMAVLSGASTYATGHAFKSHFENGGTILDIDLGRLKKYYNERFEKGKKEAREFNEKEKSENVNESPIGGKSGDPGSQELIQKLKDLGELKREGIITEEEFERMKKKFLNDT